MAPNRPGHLERSKEKSKRRKGLANRRCSFAAYSRATVRQLNFRNQRGLGQKSRSVQHSTAENALLPQQNLVALTAEPGSVVFGVDALAASPDLIALSDP
jgi:hypothetical protein